MFKCNHRDLLIISYSYVQNSWNSLHIFIKYITMVLLMSCKAHTALIISCWYISFTQRLSVRCTYELLKSTKYFLYLPTHILSHFHIKLRSNRDANYKKCTWNQKVHTSHTHELHMAEIGTEKMRQVGATVWHDYTLSIWGGGGGGGKRERGSNWCFFLKL